MKYYFLYGMTSCLMLLALAGCNSMIAGTWQSVEPTNVPPDVRQIREIRFDGDRTFDARLLQHRRITTMTGTYEFTADKLILTPLDQSDPKRYEYKAHSVGEVLALTQSDLTYSLRRNPSAPSTNHPLPTLETPSTQPSP